MGNVFGGESSKFFTDCAEGCNGCGCGDWDVKILNPCMIRETSNKELMTVLKEFDFKGETEDKWYGEAQILEHKVQKEIIILKVVESTSEQEAEQVHQSFIRRLKLNHDNILKLRFLVHKSVDAFCSIVFKSYLFFDYVLTDLASELKHRHKKELPFQEEEIWNMAYCLISGMKYFASINLSHGCIRSQNVYISQYGGFKLADPGLFNYEVSYDIIFRDRETNVKVVCSFILGYFCCDKGLERNVENPIHDAQKSDVFCVGMVLLEAATLLSADSCFDYYHCWVLDDKIQDRLNDIKIKYHDSLYYMIKEMLTLNEVQRPDFASLFDRNQRNPRFRATNSPSYQAQAQQQINSPDLSDTASVMNGSYLGGTKQVQQQVPSYQTPGLMGAGGVQSQIYPSNQLQKSNLQNYGANLVVSKPFDNVSVFDQQENNQALPNFGGYEYMGGTSYNISSNNLMGQQSQMPAPIMGGGGGGYNFSSSTYVPGFDFTSTKMTSTKAGREKVCENYKNGSRYEGEVRNGVREGKGKYYYNNGGYYEGSWKEGKMNGQGSLYFPDGSTAYDGSWREDQFHGYGTLYNNYVESFSGALDYKNLGGVGERWLKFEGDFKQDQKEGFGTFYFSNGERYVGGFKADKAHGQGTFFVKNGQSIKGRWANNLMS